MERRYKISVSSIFVAILVVWVLSYATWNPVSASIAYVLLALIFLGILVSNQQCEEDDFSKFERVVSAFLFSYIIFFRILYAPLNQFFFGSFINKASFASDLLSLILFAIFFFLFGTAFLVINTYSRVGFLSNWRFLNNEKMFFVLRGLFVSAIMILFLFYIRNSFFSIKNSAALNAVFPPATCNWTYLKYTDYLSTGRVVAGRDICLYNYSQDKNDQKICSLINDAETKSFCMQYFLKRTE